MDLSVLIQYLIMFYNDQPVDWLLDGIVETKACNIDKVSKLFMLGINGL